MLNDSKEQLLQTIFKQRDKSPKGFPYILFYGWLTFGGF